MTRRRPGTAAAATLLALAFAADGSGHAAPSPAAAALVAQHASYDLSLSAVHGGDTVAASGHMTFTITDTCTGWSTQQQLRLHTVTRDGGASDLTSDYATLESKDGRRLVFDMRQQLDGALSQQVRGEADTGPPGQPGTIRYTLPHRFQLPLPPGTLFPMAHTAAILAAARAGAHSISPLLFDGTGVDGAQDTYVTLLGWHPPPSGTRWPALASLASAPVHVAFFARHPGTITPDYESAMRYFGNGVADRMVMDFGGFSMDGTLIGLVLPARDPACQDAPSRREADPGR